MAGLAASTVTPGSTPPEPSLTVPVRVPCAAAIDGSSKAAATTSSTYFNPRMETDSFGIPPQFHESLQSRRYPPDSHPDDTKLAKPKRTHANEGKINARTARGIGPTAFASNAIRRAEIYACVKRMSNRICQSSDIPVYLDGYNALPQASSTYFDADFRQFRAQPVEIEAQPHCVTASDQKSHCTVIFVERAVNTDVATGQVVVGL